MCQSKEAGTLLRHSNEDSTHSTTVHPHLTRTHLVISLHTESHGLEKKPDVYACGLKVDPRTGCVVTAGTTGTLQVYDAVLDRHVRDVQVCILCCFFTCVSFSSHATCKPGYT